MPKNANSKENILDAAEAVVGENGPGHLSLDVVARKAGVSKGGLMYHFPTKEALLKAMLVRLLTGFYADREKKMRSIPDGRGRLFKAGILACMDRDAKMDRTGLAILAAAAYDPDLLGPMRQANAEHAQALKASGLSLVRASIVSLASDGLMLNELLHISPYNAAERKRIKEEMMCMIDECASTDRRARKA